jgi:hypothetical protein
MTALAAKGSGNIIQKRTLIVKENLDEFSGEHLRAWTHRCYLYARSARFPAMIEKRPPRQRLDDLFENLT